MRRRGAVLVGLAAVTASLLVVLLTGGFRAGRAVQESQRRSSEAPEPGRPTLVATARAEDARPDPAVAATAAALSDAPGESDHRRRFRKETREALDLLAAGDVASWIAAARRIKVTALSARSADPEFLAILRDEALAALLPGLADTRFVEGRPRDTVRRAVVDALETWDWDGTIVVERLKAAFADGSPALRVGILDALTAIEPRTLPPRADLRALVGSGGDDLAASALEALARHPSPAEEGDVDVAGGALGSSSSAARAAALRVLESHPLHAWRWTNEIEALWRDSDREVRRSAVSALARADPERARRLALDRLAGGDTVARREAVWAFVPLKGGLREAEAQALLTALADVDSSVRASAANALAGLPALRDRSVPLLRALVASGGYPAYEALAALAGLDLEGAIPDLQAAFDSPEPNLRSLAVKKLGDHAPARFGSEIVDALGDEDAQVRHAAQRVAGKIQRPPIDGLVRALERGHPSVRPTVVSLLRRQGPRAAPALPALERLADDPAVGRAVREAIATIRGER